MKLIDKLRSAASEGRPFYSFEYFPPKTEAGIENLYARIERMGRLAPAFVDVTWGAGGSTAELTFELATTIENVLGLETMMHLTCTNMPRRKIAAVLEDCRQRGIGNILALRGDPPRGRGAWSRVPDGFAHASTWCASSARSTAITLESASGAIPKGTRRLRAGSAIWTIWPRRWRPARTS